MRFSRSFIDTSVVGRIAAYYRRHGFVATAKRCGSGARRVSYLGRLNLYCCTLPLSAPAPKANVTVERMHEWTVSPQDYETIANEWNPAITSHLMAARFSAGADLWLARLETKLAGFGWSLRGNTIEPHFFPLHRDDAHLFDFFVFPSSRGLGVNVSLVFEILQRLGADGVRRAHVECAAWNTAQIRSLAKTPFRRYAQATKLRLFGRTYVVWHQVLPSAGVDAQASNAAISAYC